MEFGYAFNYPFKDPDLFKKLIIVGLVTLIPVIGMFVVMGWMIALTRRIIRREEPALLPDLDFSVQLGDGFKAFVVYLVYLAPLFVIYALFAIGGIVGSQFIESLDMDTQGTIILISTLCLTGFIFLYTLFVSFIIPAAFAKVATEGSIKAGLQIGEVLATVKASIGSYLLVLVGVILANMIGSLGTVAFFFGWFITYPYSVAVAGVFYGMAYNAARENRGLPAPMPGTNLNTL